MLDMLLFDMVFKKQIYVSNTDLFLVIVFCILVAELPTASSDSFGLAVDCRMEQQDDAKYHIGGI